MAHKDLEKPLQTLSCTCCGQSFKGRQWWNQDTGHGLGNCCFYLVKQGYGSAEEFQQTYGIIGVHINAGSGSH